MHLYFSHLVALFRFVGLFRSVLVPAGLVTLIISTGCGSSNWTASQHKTAAPPPSVADVAATGTLTPSTVPPVLLFVGAGTSSGDVSAVKTILNDMGIRFATANSSQLDGMTETELLKYRLFLMPGGNAVTIGNNLTRTATTNVRNAIIYGGMHYLGICAGAFLADDSIYNYLHLTGILYKFYALYYSGTTKAAVEVSSPNGSKLDQYWQDGPELNGWGKVVAKYPNGSAAVVEGFAGKGWVILSGMHPEAPASWRYGMSFTSTVAADNAYAKTLVNAALNGTWLAHY